MRERILERIFGTRDRTRIPTLTLDEADWRAARELLGSKYGTWAWNYGQNPGCNVQRALRFPVGEIDVRLDIQQGRIAGLRIFGDFMGAPTCARSRHDSAAWRTSGTSWPAR